MLSTIPVESSIFGAWLVQNVALQMHTTQFLKFKQLPNLSIWNLPFILLSIRGSFKTTIKNISRRSLEHFFRKFLCYQKVTIKVSLAEFSFSKVPCFQHIPLSNITRTTLKFFILKLFFKRHLILDIKIIF